MQIEECCLWLNTYWLYLTQFFMCKWYDAEKSLMRVNLVCENFEIAHFKCVFVFIKKELLYCN